MGRPSPPKNTLPNCGCVAVFIVMGAIGFNALFADGGTVHEMDGSGLRALIGGVIGMLFGLVVILDS